MRKGVPRGNKAQMTIAVGIPIVVDVETIRIKVADIDTVAIRIQNIVCFYPSHQKWKALSVLCFLYFISKQSRIKSEHLR